MMNLRKCKKCEEHFDIDTSKELCPRCRGTEINEEVVWDETRRES